MPSVVRSEKWFVRITLPHTILQEKTATVLGWVDLTSMLFIGHTGDKTEKEHGHMLLHLSTSLQKQSLDARLKAVFGVKGADYLSKSWDGADAAGGYMFHDAKYLVLGNKGFAADVIERYVELNKKTQAVISVNKDKGGNKNVEAVLAQFQGEHPSKDEICTAFLQRIRQGDMYDPGDWKLKSMTEEVEMKLCTTDVEFNLYCYARLKNIYR